jgi:hypothetical protein
MMVTVFRDFDGAPAPAPIEVLVAIDGRIRMVPRHRPAYRPCERDGRLIYDTRWG